MSSRYTNAQHARISSINPATTTTNLTQQSTASSYSSATASTGTGASMSMNKQRQYTHLHAQLAQLNAHLADTENLLRMTSMQAQDMRFLGGYVGALFVGAGRVLGEESVRGREERMGGGGGGDGKS